MGSLMVAKKSQDAQPPVATLLGAQRSQVHEMRLSLAKVLLGMHGKSI